MEEQNLSKRQMAYKLREEEGMTFQQIGDALGISKQRASQFVYDMQRKEVKEKRFRPSVWNQCVYEGLRDWALKDKIALNRFCVLMGYKYSPNTILKMRNRISGKTDLKKSEIDRVLKLTKGKYENIFRIREMGETEE